jgi:hypothetical protein
MDHDQWPEPTPRANLELRRERTGIYLRGKAGHLEWEMQGNTEGQEGSAEDHSVAVMGDLYTSAWFSGRPMATVPAAFTYQGLTPSRYSWVLRPKIALLRGLHVIGAEHPEISADPSKLARWAAEAAEARDQYATLLPVIARLLGTDNSDTLVAWSNFAAWTGEAGDAAAARDEFGSLLPEVERVLGADHPETVSTRANLARWTGEAGDAAAARDQYAALLPEVERVLGAHHPGTLVVRNNHAAWTGEAGNTSAARDEFAALLPEVERVLGADHLDTMVVQNNLASFSPTETGRDGEAIEGEPADLLAGSGGGDGGGTGPDETGLPPAGRYLLGRFPDTVKPGKVFSVLVSVTRSGGAPLKLFDVPAGGRLLALIIIAPGLRVVSDDRQTVLVPPSGDSEPVKFDLIGDEPGPQRMSVTAWDGGTYLGELPVEVSVERDGPARPYREATSKVREESTDGEVTLLVRYDPHQTAYRFEFIDVDFPDEVTTQLVYDPGPAVERLIRRLNELAEGTAGYSAAATRAYLVNEGVALWQELLPEKLRSQFWERQRRITQLTILANRDVVPWELLYPKDPRQDAGFLVEQFPVTRAIYGRAQQRRLWLQPARFVIPPHSPKEARAEARTLAKLLGTRLTAISDLMPLVQLISKGRFGLLHFACHNRFDADDGSSIRLDSLFTPTFLTTAASDQTLARTTPVVFINACRSAGQVPSYNKLDGWAEKFLRAGAAAFIGTLWEVSDGMAREFAQELYRRLVGGDQLGKAVMAARQAVAGEPGDPTWLAYAVYGDPQARVDLR